MTIEFEGKKEESIYIRLSEYTKEKLDNLARQHNTNRSEIARKLIVEGLKVANDSKTN